MTCQELKSASVLIVGPQTRSKQYIASDFSPVDNPFFLDAHVHDVISSGVRQNRYSSMTALIGATSRHGVSRELIYASSVS